MARPRKHPAGAQTPLLTADAAPLPEIPVAEQPYPLPKGWKWVRLGDVLTPSKEKTEKFSSSLRYVGLEHIEKNNGIIDSASAEEIRSLKNIFHSGQILYGKLRPYLNKHDIANFSGVCSTDILVFNCRKNVYNKFANYTFNLSYFTEYAIANSKGINLPRVSEHVILNAPFPLPPREEQERIVARIESLFAKLDEAREKIVAVAERYEPRRAALLHKAFSGELTAKWREEKGNAAGWKNVLFSDVADIKSNLVDPADFQTFPHIAPDNIEKKTGILLQYNTVAEDKVTSGKHRFYPGQILYSKIRPYLSKVVIVDFDGLCSADMYPIDAKENTKYLWYYMLSEEFLEQASTAGSRSVLPKINQKELSRIRIPLPPLPEQEEIVRLLDGLLERERQIREAAEQVRERIDLMKKAILARAFRGELGEDGGATH